MKCIYQSIGQQPNRKMGNEHEQIVLRKEIRVSIKHKQPHNKICKLNENEIAFHLTDLQRPKCLMIDFFKEDAGKQAFIHC